MSLQKPYDYIFKILIVGDSGVGKSALLARFADDQFSESFIATIGVDFKIRTISIGGKNVKLQIWDTAGQERFRSITNSYYRGCCAAIVVYDITSEQSFRRVKSWFNELGTYCRKDVEVILVGSKSDREEYRQVSTLQGEEFASAKHVVFMETSAKNGSNVDALFQRLARELVSKTGNRISDSGKGVVSPGGRNLLGDSRKCCS